jgi:hypothetical protein
MHGEHMHLREHVRIARAKGIAGAIAVNGTMLDITGAVPTIAAYEEAGRTYLDGGVLIGALDGVVRDRIRMALNGHVTVTVIVDEEDEPLGEPWCDTMGLPEKGRSKAPLVEVLEEDLSQFLGRADRQDDPRRGEARRGAPADRAEDGAERGGQEARGHGGGEPARTDGRPALSARALRTRAVARATAFVSPAARSGLRRGPPPAGVFRPR